jgi:hypothetical protein
VAAPADEAAIGQAERAWRAQGVMSPLLALPPAPLIRLVERAVAHVTQTTASADARRQARAVGFMTWPTAP